MVLNITKNLKAVGEMVLKKTNPYILVEVKIHGKYPKQACALKNSVEQNIKDTAKKE